MKKIFSIIAACAMTVAASAQIVSSSSRSLVAEEYPNYSRIFVSYAPMQLSPEHGESITATGVELGWQGGWSVSKTMPLYVEGGLNLRYNWNTEEESKGDYSYKVSDTFLSLNVPVNIAYKWAIPGAEDLSLVPYIGLHLTGNIIGSEKEEWDEYGYSGDETYNFFDEDDMGKDNTASRFQIGWQIGVGLNFKKLYLGVGYSAEFGGYFEKVNTGGFRFSLGLNL